MVRVGLVGVSAHALAPRTNAIAMRAVSASVDDDQEQDSTRERLQGAGCHSVKRAAVRSPEFRALPPKIQELISGTDFNTLRATYDSVDVEAAREAYEAAKKAVSA